MRQINKIVIHCADTPAGMDIGAEEIRRWHTDPRPNGNGWSDIGYHWVIRRDGTVEPGRPEEDPGAHVAGHNADSIGVCVVGGKDGFNFTRRQMAALEAKVIDLTSQHPGAKVVGHTDLDPRKPCPNFDVIEWWQE